MSYPTKYVQNQGNCSGHWKGTPPGGTNPGSGKCWACKYGCAVLSVLAITGIDPNEFGICANVNGNADCKWLGFSSVSSPTKLPCIAGSGSHYVILTKDGGSTWSVWDPSGGKVYTVPKSQSFPSYHVRR